MYDVMIVDHNYYTTGKIKYNTDWNAEGFNVVCITQSAIDAVSFLAEHRVDIVFTEIDLPALNGIELIRHIRERYPHTKVVVVTDNTSLSTVKKAFFYNVFDYIEKDVLTPDTLCNLLTRFKASEKKLSRSSSEKYIETDPNLSRYREHVINVMTGIESDPGLNNMLVAAVKIFNYPLLRQLHSNEELDILVQNIINTMVQVVKEMTNTVIFRDGMNNIILCMQFSPDTPETAIMNSINSYVRSINALIKKFFNLSLSWGISSLSTPNYGIRQCREEAVKMLEDTPIAERKLHYDIPELSSISLDEEKKLLAAIQTLDYNSIDTCLDEIFAQRIHSNLSIHILAGELMSIANRLCSELNIDLSHGELSEINTFAGDDTDAERGLEWCKDLFHNIIRLHMEHTRPSRHSTYAKFVRTFIAENYKEDISLKAIAAAMGITEQHLSKIFKDETGENLSVYLNRFRIDKAKVLLENDVNIKYLYSEVGFKNYNYFFVAFKKAVGCTPVEYKKSHVRKRETPKEEKLETDIPKTKNKDDEIQ